MSTLSRLTTHRTGSPCRRPRTTSVGNCRTVRRRSGDHNRTNAVEGGTGSGSRWAGYPTGGDVVPTTLRRASRGAGFPIRNGVADQARQPAPRRRRLLQSVMAAASRYCGWRLPRAHEHRGPCLAARSAAVPPRCRVSILTDARVSPPRHTVQHLKPARRKPGQGATGWRYPPSRGSWSPLPQWNDSLHGRPGFMSKSGERAHAGCTPFLSPSRLGSYVQRLVTDPSLILNNTRTLSGY